MLWHTGARTQHLDHKHGERFRKIPKRVAVAVDFGWIDSFRGFGSPGIEDLGPSSLKRTRRDDCVSD